MPKMATRATLTLVLRKLVMGIPPRAATMSSSLTAADAQDGYKGYVNFGAEEARDGYSTKGSYHVLLPDGRTQIVTYYTTDGYSGNVMDVQYEGKASYHEPAPHHAAPHKSHHAPTYHA